MGFAKYHEDNLEINDERMYYRNASTLPSVQISYTRVAPQIEYKVFCPFCRSGFMTHKNLIDHILASHGGVHELVYLNDRRIYGKEQSVNKVRSLTLYCFEESPKEIHLVDGMGENYSFWTKAGTYEYDIQSILQARLYSELFISNIDAPVRIKQQLDICKASTGKILAGKYTSFLFDEQFSEGQLSLDGCLLYLKMLIHEGTETESFMGRVDDMQLDESRELEELYYYHYLHNGSVEDIKDRALHDIPMTLLALLNGRYADADATLKNSTGNTNDQYGCMIILGLLKNDRLGVDFQVEKYEPYGIIGTLEQVLYHLAMYEKEPPRLLIEELDELRLFENYPLIKAIEELYNAINRRSALSYNSYSLLRDLTPLAAIHYCYSIDDPSVREKVLKSMVKTHKDSALIKELAFQNDYGWMKRRIFVSDGDLYRRTVIKENAERGGVFSERFINAFPFDEHIQITPLGGEHEIGASCYVISYKGYNIMLDCGINTQINGDDAYPQLDQWGREIDAIIISHAHVDHSGGVPKAHAMWPDARIISTAPTKVFLKYLFSDIAKVKNGITDEFEIENITIEREVALDTLNSMTTVDYEEWIYLGKSIRIRLHPAGHIIGAAMIELWVNGKTILYTGDYCNYNQALAGNYDLATLPQNVDYLITESTYLRRPRVDWKRQCNDLKAAVRKGIKAHQAILLPASAVGRSQELACLIGEMRLAGEIPEDIPLYLAGMAIPATTQIIPFMNERYAEIIGLYEEFDGHSYPDENAIVIASSGAMSKGSASNKIARYWTDQRVKYSIIANGYLDEDAETDNRYMDRYHQVQRLSLSTHADLKGIFELIEYVSPKVISFVHRGNGTDVDIRSLMSTCRDMFSNDIVCHDLQAERSDKIFDMLEWLLEGAY